MVEDGQVKEGGADQTDDKVLDLTGIFESGEKVQSVGFPDGVD